MSTGRQPSREHHSVGVGVGVGVGVERQATSDERRATSDERRATSDEQRATSDQGPLRESASEGVTASSVMQPMVVELTAYARIEFRGRGSRT